jgi:uncharacterized alpha-E superfamily protein
MLSRVAESIYWMNRYLERAENVARFIHVNLHLVLDQATATGEQWAPLVLVSGDHEDFAKRYGAATRERVIDFLTFDQENPNAILSCLSHARENARSVREIISSEMWEQINRFYLLVKGAVRERALETPHDFFTEIKMASHLYGGIAEATMSRGEGWHFGRLGGLLERADKTSRILDVKYFVLLPDPADVGTPADNVQWAALLRSASAFEMYRKRFGLIAPERIADFLILDREFPRAILHCLIEGEDSLRTLTGSAAATFHNEAEQELGRLRAELSYAQVEEVIAGGLHEFLDDLQVRLNRIDVAVFSTFFALRPVGRAKVLSREQT